MNKEVYFNPFQLKVALLYPKELYATAGRGTGKSTAIIAPRTIGCAINMPGSTNGIIAKNNVQNLTRIMPAVVSGWRQMGFIEGIHYTYGKADKKLRFEEPSVKPLLWERTLHFFTGAIFPLVSQERKGNAAGFSFQSLHGDEAKFLKYDELKEGAFPAMRGLAKFEDLVEYKMKTFVSSMPTSPSGMWLVDMEKQMDPEGLQLMWYLIDKMNNCDPDGRTYAEYAKMLHALRQTNPIYLESSSFDNIDILRPEYFKTAFRDLDAYTFKTEIMNVRPGKVENNFYPTLSAKNFYEADYNSNHYDPIAMNDISDDDVNSLGDNDCMHQVPLIVSIDWGANINSMVVAQEDINNNTLKVIKCFYVKKPEYILHLVKAFCKYYQYHGERVIRLIYDRNGRTSVGNSPETYAEYATRLLYENDWVVLDLIDNVDNPSHDDKFEFFKILFAEKDSRLPKIRINEDNAYDLKISCENAETKVVRGRVEKNKNSERNKFIPQEHATHLSDALDYMLYVLYRNNIESGIGFMGMIG